MVQTFRVVKHIGPQKDRVFDTKVLETVKPFFELNVWLKECLDIVQIVFSVNDVLQHLALKYLQVFNLLLTSNLSRYHFNRCFIFIELLKQLELLSIEQQAALLVYLFD
jgi:hypothetical protein